MELILKVEPHKLTKEARILLMDFIAASDPKPLKTEKELAAEKIQAKPEQEQVKERKAPGRPVKTKAESVDEDDTDYKASFDLDENDEDEKDPFSPNGEETSLTLETIKDKVIALRDKGKREKTLAIMKKFNIAKLSDLEEDDFDSFYAALNNVK